MKTCFKCNAVLPLTEFYRHPQMGDGHLGKCKRCTRRDVQDNYAAKREQYLAYERGRYRARYEAGAFQPRDSKKNRARLALRARIASGQIQRQACQVCGAPNAEAHHENYDKPLEIVWLCKIHHRMAHRIDPERRSA